ncbi:unnamed protein product [Acanthoscelides obtectus]|uniref:Secreted protein n=1 Tax=Acanthoscelides obtectus TaxID=200917 RepID=A0A9P0KIP1_ACAOB|nr:unnamed protein product [Acanthoscelides obtectus]CAK1654477.1 hypothetical protein AOBTE_LOCUS18627 [Acanthoscelides obtectus]
MQFWKQGSLAASLSLWRFSSLRWWLFRLLERAVPPKEMDKLGGEIKTTQGNEVCQSATANNKLIFSIATPTMTFSRCYSEQREIHHLYVAIPALRLLTFQRDILCVGIR